MGQDKSSTHLNRQWHLFSLAKLRQKEKFKITNFAKKGSDFQCF
jgi:hypothetical protein